MGMLAAVEAWTTRDHAAEWKQWEGWLATIRESVSTIPTVRTEVLQPHGPSNYAPQLRVSWDTEKLGITGLELADLLLKGTPRIIVPGSQSSITVMPYMMMLGKDIRKGKKVKFKPMLKMKGKDVDWTDGNTQTNAGSWFLQKGDKVVGSHRGEFLSGDIRGTVEGAKLRCRSSHHYEGTSIGYLFEGVADGDTMRGTVDVGEYGQAPFTARRHFHA